MNLPPHQRVAIVTGASSAIGAVIAKRLAKDNIAVVVHYLKNAQSAENIVSEINSLGGMATAIEADVSRSVEVATMFNRTLNIFGAIDIVINNAGMMPENKPLADVDDVIFNLII